MPRRSRRRRGRGKFPFGQNSYIVFFWGAAVGIIGFWLAVKLINSPLVASIFSERNVAQSIPSHLSESSSASITRILPSDLNPGTSHKSVPPPLKASKTIFGLKKESTPLVSQSRKGPKIVFVIDDIGYHDRYETLLFSTGVPLTLAILPQLSFSTHFSKEGEKRGYEIILHQPMEPETRISDPDPGTITTRMNKGEVKKVLTQNLATVPDAEGINNHMGSKVTQNAKTMRWVLEELKKRKLFFLDSMTTENSIGWLTAGEMKVQNLKRSVFLDNENDTKYIESRIRELIESAKLHGFAIGIGHYRQTTLESIKKMSPQIKKQGVQIVNLKEILEQ